MLGATLSIVPWTLDFRSEDFGWNLTFCCTLHTALCSGQSVTKCKSKCRLCYFLGNVTLDQAGPRSIKCFLNLKKKSILLKRKSWAELSLLLLFTSSCVTQDKTSDLKEKPSVKKRIVTRHCCRKDNVQNKVLADFSCPQHTMHIITNAWCCKITPRGKHMGSEHDRGRM